MQNREEMNLSVAQGVAVREFKLKQGHGYADYLLLVDGKAIGVLEAKAPGHTLIGVEPQSTKYAHGLPDGFNPPITPLPFLYVSTGGVTKFTNLLDPEPRSRFVFHVHRPETLAEWLSAPTLDAWVRDNGAYTAADDTKPSSRCNPRGDRGCSRTHLEELTMALRAVCFAAPCFAALAACALDEPTAATSDETTDAVSAHRDRGIHKVNHVIVIMQENHSFDNYFGALAYAPGTPFHGPRHRHDDGDGDADDRGGCRQNDNDCVDGLSCRVDHAGNFERFAAARPVRIALHPSDLASTPVVVTAERAVRRLAAACPSATTAAALGLASP